MLKFSDIDLSGKRVLIRADLNVPIENGQITSTTRIKAILPTLKIALEQNSAIILMSHLGRPKEGQFDAALSLQPVATCLSDYLGQPINLVQSLDQVTVAPGQVVLLENTRFLVGEKENDPALGQRLAALCDVFVMDAFATAHRKEASTYGVAQYAPLACAGPLLVSEIEALSKVMQSPKRPLVAVVGGSKVSTKLMVLKNILSQVDCLVLGGGIANTFLAAQGYSVGKSLYEAALVPEAQAMLSYAKEHNKTIPLPSDVVVATEFSAQADAVHKSIEDVSSDDMILDIGPQSSEQLQNIILNAGTILWNGPLGVFEFDQFGEGTKSLALAIAKSHAFSIAGGGDTLAAIEKYQVDEDISYISTGGGAFLEFLEGKTLPAIAILEKNQDPHPNPLPQAVEGTR
jgi:phosphoglycerate kinase